MKICSNCGNQMDDAARFCVACGATQVVNASPKKGKKLWLIPVIIGGVCLVGLMIFISLRVAGVTGESRTKEEAIEEFFEADAEMDAEAYVDVMWSKSMLEVAEEIYDMDKEEMIEEREEEFEDWEYWDYEFKYKNLEVEDIDELDKDEVEEFVEEIEDEFDVKVSIQAMCEMEVSYKYWSSYSEDWVEYEEDYVLYKSSGKWYVFDRVMLDFYDDVFN